MENINYEDLAKQLLQILDYDDGYFGRPLEICEELMNRWGRFYDVELYHGSSNSDFDDIRFSYDGFVSFSRDIEVAKDFTDKSTTGNKLLLKLTGRVYALDVPELITKCLENTDNSAICEFIYEDYYNENEMLIYAEDMFSHSVKLEVINV